MSVYKTVYLIKSKNSAGRSSEADMFLKTWDLEDHYTNICVCQGAWFNMWEKWWNKLDVVWKNKFALGELVWFGTKTHIELQNNWFLKNCDAKSYYRKLHNMFLPFGHKGFSKNGFKQLFVRNKSKIRKHHKHNMFCI